MTSTADAPSVSGEELPGVIRQSISGNRADISSVRNDGRSPARPSAVVVPRTVSSVVTPGASGTATTSASNPPSAQVRAARRCDSAE